LTNVQNSFTGSSEQLICSSDLKISQQLKRVATVYYLVNIILKSWH